MWSEGEFVFRFQSLLGISESYFSIIIELSSGFKVSLKVVWAVASFGSVNLSMEHLEVLINIASP